MLLICISPRIFPFFVPHLIPRFTTPSRAKDVTDTHLQSCQHPAIQS